MPVAQAEIFNNANGRRVADLAGVMEFRLTAVQTAAGAAGAVLRGQFSTDAGSSWTNIEAAPGTTADLLIAGGTGLKVGLWAQVNVAAAADVQLRLIGQGGDASADPAFRYIGIEFR